MLLILCVMFFTCPSIVSSGFIPNYIWDSSDMATYGSCFEKFGDRLPWDPSTELRDTAAKSDIRRMQGSKIFRTWPNGRVPYELANNIQSSDSLKRVACGMLLFHSTSCVRFVPKRKDDYSYLLITNEPDEGCYSDLIGMDPYGIHQEINLGDGCWRHGTIVHELMHAIGFFHEQQRDDRDQYITINWQNIDNNWHYEFFKSSKHGYNVTLIGKYDYSSIMHYGRYGVSNNGGPTMTALKSPVDENNGRMGSRYGPTPQDLYKINHLYSCPEEPMTTNGPTKLTTRTTRSTTRTWHPTSTERITTTSSPLNKACIDISPYCAAHKHKCYWNEYVQKMCQKSCCFCTPPSICYDFSPNCPINLDHCYRWEFVDWRCQKSCSHCDCRDIWTHTCHRLLHQCSTNIHVGQRCKKSCGYC